MKLAIITSHVNLILDKFKGKDIFYQTIFLQKKRLQY